MVELILSVSIALVISAMCSLFEASLYSIPMSHVEMMVQSGSKAGRILKDLRQEIQRPISAILTLNTVANTAGAAIAGSAATIVFGHKWLGVFTALFTLAILFLSEIIPKTAGVAYSQTLAPLIARPLLWFVWVFTPVVWLVQFMTRLVAKDKIETIVSAEEIIALARMGRRAGKIHPDEERVIRNILILKMKKAHEIMTPRTVVFSLSEHLTLREAREKGGLWPHSRVPVYDKDQEDIVGLVLRKDLLAALADDREDLRLSDLMRPVHFVPESATADKLLTEFLERRQHLFVVIDEYGGLSGVLSLEDVLEEIVGREIVDELDKAEDMRELARRRRSEFLEKREKLNGQD